MRIHIDSLLKIGKTHKVCEDYIISGNNPVPYIILSDGCSSSKDTDIGARILCHKAKQYLQRYTNSFDSINGIEMGDYIIWSSKLAIDLLGLDITALDATLIIAYYYNGLININMYGDGCIAVIDKTSTMIEIVEYSKNTPYYLSYKLDYERNEIYHNNKITKTVDRHYYYNSADTFDLITGAMDYDKPYISKHLFDLDRDKTIFIFSDGISTFFNKEQSKFLSIADFIKDFSSFKTLKGEFLQRRLLSKKGAITKLEDY
jgi:hypothetical protein